MPIIDDIYLEKFGKLTIIITDEGVFKTINDSSVNYEFIITIRSLDSNLISHIMYHHCTVGHDMWTYNYNIFYIKEILNKNHPGICIEIHDVDNTLLFSKNYHGTKKFRCLDLKSKQGDTTYPSYHTFFYDDYFTSNFNIKDGDVVYDLGANIGAFSIACSNFDIKQIYAFEPHPELSQYLNDNLNRYGKNTKVFNNAISSEFKKVRFGTTESTVASRIRNEGEFEVDAINLEKFVIDNNLELPTYLKIDIEGAEYEFFENTSDNFFKNVRSIFFEFHCNDGVNLLKIIDRFKNLGYKLSHKDNALDHNLSHMNTVYLNK
jgi:FkbM family methyltransferase